MWCHSFIIININDIILGVQSQSLLLLKVLILVHVLVAVLTLSHYPLVFLAFVLWLKTWFSLVFDLERILLQWIFLVEVPDEFVLIKSILILETSLSYFHPVIRGIVWVLSEKWLGMVELLAIYHLIWVNTQRIIRLCFWACEVELIQIL